MTVELERPKTGKDTNLRTKSAVCNEGDRFDFITANGERREYVVTRAEDSTEALGLAARVWLRSLATNGEAIVTVKWLIDPPGHNGSCWERVE